jgi:hypothetical protein
MDDYSLTLEAGPLSDGLRPVLLMGEGEVHAPPVNEAGGFENYRPIDTLPQYGNLVIQFAP